MELKRYALMISGIFHQNQEELHRISDVILNIDQIIIHDTTSMYKEPT